MLLRFSSPDGQFRVNVDPNVTFASLASLIAERLPKDVDLSTLTLNNQARKEGQRLLSDIKNVTLSRVGLGYGLDGMYFVNADSCQQARRPDFPELPEA
jgi:nuclear protein localization protein 4 homolog